MEGSASPVMVSRPDGSAVPIDVYVVRHVKSLASSLVNPRAITRGFVPCPNLIDEIMGC